MFQLILEWIRKVINRMIGKNTVKQALGVNIDISSDMLTALETWSRMYENKSPWLAKDIHSLNLAAAIAGEISRAVTIEMAVEFEGSARASWLEEQFTKVLDRMREMVEKGSAKGGLMMKPWIDGENLVIDYVQADQFYPINFDSNGNITSCVFVDQRKVGDKFYTRLELHQMTDEGCVIRNVAYKSTNRDTLGTEVPLSMIDDWAELEPEATITGIDRPLFAYFKYPLANNIDATSPLGVSCYSRAVDLIQDADLQWSNFLWEFESGQRALYVDVLAFGKDSDGNPILPNKRLYRFIDAGGQEDALFKEWSPTLRQEDLLDGLDAILKRIELTCGLAYGTLSDPNIEVKTATEIKISKQRTYATIVDTQKALQDALEQLIWAMDVWATIGKLAPQGGFQTAFTFDDSVLVDQDAQFQQDLRLVGQGIMSKVEFRMRNFKETEVVAKQKILEAQAEIVPEPMFGGEA
jgi:A118 family predicted phage portal protein